MSNVAKSWVLTLNNPEPADEAFFMNIIVSKIVLAKEVGESGTPHLQGFITFTKSQRLSALKKLSPRTHWEIAKAVDAAANYCMKENIIRKEGFEKKRKASEAALELVQQGRSVKQIIEEVPTLSLQSSNLQRLVSTMVEPNVRTEPPQIIWITGPSGSGKTRYVFEKDPEVNEVMFQNHFLMNYEPNSKAVLIDDLKKNDIPFGILLRILDRYPNRPIPIKGGSVNWNPSIIYITSIHHPDNICPHQEDKVQLFRRISSFINLP